MRIAAAAILWLLLPQFKRLKERKVRITVLVLCAALVAALWGSGLLESLVLRSLNRFLHGMEDAGNAGRIRMWTYALETSKAYPFGCGVGNCMKALSGVAGFAYGEDNIHNVYLQNLIDCGWLGGAAYLAPVLLDGKEKAAARSVCGGAVYLLRGLSASVPRRRYAGFPAAGHVSGVPGCRQQKRKLGRKNSIR